MADAFEFDEKWRVLRQRFIARLEERQRLISTAWQSVRSHNDPTGQARNLLFHEVHSLTGSGATFGYAELSAAARVIEPMIDPVKLPLTESLNDKALAEIGDALAGLSAELRRVNPSIPE